MTQPGETQMKTVCLFGPNLPSFYMDANPASEALENYAIDLWHAGFGVLSPHLNAPRSSGRVISPELQFAFDARAIKGFADAVFVMPGWEADEGLWLRVAWATSVGKPVFDSLAQISRWWHGKYYAEFEIPTAPSVIMRHEDMFVLVDKIKIAFVAGKYFVGERRGKTAEGKDFWVPDRNAIHENILAANRSAITLWQEGLGAFTPHNNTNHFELKTRIDEPTYQEFDRLLLERFVDGVVVLPSWVNSSGAPKEVALAQRLGKPVMNDYDLVSIRNWRDGKGRVNVIAFLDQ